MEIEHCPSEEVVADLAVVNSPQKIAHCPSSDTILDITVALAREVEAAAHLPATPWPSLLEGEQSAGPPLLLETSVLDPVT
jgi:hypothetical protein